MMIKPSITELDTCVDSRYTLVSMVAKRARMIGMERPSISDEGAAYDANAEKPVTQAVDEIAKGVVGYVRSDAIDRAIEYEAEKVMAIAKLESTLAEEEGKDEAEEAAQAENEPVDEMADDLFGDDLEYSAIDAALKLARENEASRND